MPNAVFFCAPFSRLCGIAIHATTQSHYPELGTRASGGCVRTKLDISKQLRELVMEEGFGKGSGQFKVIADAGYPKRLQVHNNSISVDNIDRNSGSMINEKVKAWDTLIVVYE